MIGPILSPPPDRSPPEPRRLHFHLIAASRRCSSVRASVSSYAIDYQWWKEMGQLHTWFSMLLYSVIPATAATVLGFVIFWIAHARGSEARRHVGCARIRCTPSSPRSAIFLLALMVALAALDTWTVVRYFGGTRGATGDFVARSGLRQSADVLSLRIALLFRPAGPGAGHRRDRGHHLLGDRSRLAASQQRSRLERSARDQPEPTRAWAARSKPVSCAASARCSCSPWRCASSWAATACCWMSTAASWWASIMSIRTSLCRCNGC